MKKILCAAIAAIMLLCCFASCNAGSSKYKIGICNYVDDASLNQIVENIDGRLKEIFDGKNVSYEIEIQNCNADSTVMNQIISDFIADGVNLMVGIATPVAMQMQAATEDNRIPVVFAAVSDPVGAKLVDSLEKPGHNLTGTSDFLNTDAVMNLIVAAKPEIKKVGLLYDVGQDASTAPVAAAKVFLEAKGIAVVERTGTTVEEVTLAAQALVTDGVEAVFTPTDNTIMKSELAIADIFSNAKIPQYCGADSFALNGAFLGYGVDYANLGRETAEMIADILLNKKNPGDVAVKTFDNGTATINTDVCAKLGIDFDAISAVFKPYCTKIEKITTAENFGDLNK